VYSGYLIDIYCYRLQEQGGLSLDGSDIIRAPWEHTVHCLRDVPACRTYYLAENRATDGASDYHMKFLLDDTSNQNALTLISSTQTIDDFKVIARGMHDGRGNLINASFEECFGNRCDGVCTGSCAIDTSVMPTSTPVAPSRRPDSGHVKLGAQMSMEYSPSLDMMDISFTVKLQGDGWIGIGVSPDGTMTGSGAGSDVIACSGGQVKRYWVTSVQLSGGFDVPGAECKHGGVTTMKFTRAALAESGSQKPISTVRGMLTKFIWAHGSTRSLTYHGTSRGTVSVDVGAGGSGVSVSIAPPATLWIHAACMLFAWGALIPFGVAWARLERQNTNQFQSKPVWFAYHRICQSIGCLLQLAGVACAVVFVEKGGHSHFSTLHTILGLVVVLLGALQPLNAVFRPHPHKDNSQAHFLNARTMWEYMHKGTGYLAVLFGILNVVCGILATKNRNYGHAIVPIMSTAMGLFGVCLLVYVVFKLIRHHVSPSSIPDQDQRDEDGWQKQESQADP